MAYGTITQSYDRERAVDFLYPYDSTATGIVSKKPGQTTSIYALFRPFQPQVWIAIAVAFVAFVPTYWVSNNVIQQSAEISIKTAFFQSFQCTLMQSNTTITCLNFEKLFKSPF